MKTYAMIDIETTDITARTCILSIGIVFFNIAALGKVIYVRPALQPQLDAGRRVSSDTLNFWMNQSTDAKKDAFSEDARVSINYTIGQLRELDRADIILANDPDLDIAGIVDFYTQFAEDNTIPLFDYKKKRCFRTIKRLYDPTRDLEPERTTHHNALDDAIVQAHYFLNILEKYKLNI